MKASVNMLLLPMKAQYFLWNAGTAPIVPFLSIYARQLGFSSIIVGAIYTFLPITGMLAKPIFGAIADRYKLQKTLFLAFQVVTAVSFFAIQFIPEIPAESHVMMDCYGDTYIKKCSNETLDQCAAARIVAEAGDNTVACKLHCDMSDALQQEVCSRWNVSSVCNGHTQNTVSVIDFTAEVPMEKTEVIGSCLFFRVKHAVFSDGVARVPYCSNLTVASCSAVCESSAINEAITHTTVADSEVSTLYQFWLFFLLLITSWVGMAVVVSVGDAICFEMLGDRPSRYGQQRLWGAVGWGIFSIISGVLVDEFSEGQMKKNYTPMFYLMLAMLLLDMFVSSRLRYSQTKLSSSIARDVGKLFAEARILVFILWCVAVGLSTGLLWQFLFWHLEDLATTEGCDSQNWIKTLEGLIMGVQCFGGELPFFFLSGWILRKIGHVNAMSLVLAAFGLRFILYSILSDPWWCLPIELFQGITFGIFYATMASYASIVSPPGTEATMQGLVGAVFEGVGVSLGSLLGGVLYDRYGGATTFRTYGIGSLIVCAAHILIQYLLSRKPQYNLPAKEISDLDGEVPT